MGAAVSCCCTQPGAHLRNEAASIKDEMKVYSAGPSLGALPQGRTFRVMLNRAQGGKLGLDVDYVASGTFLPIVALTGGLAEQWNLAHPEIRMRTGDYILEVNNTRGDAQKMLEVCKSELILNLLIMRPDDDDPHCIANFEHFFSTSCCLTNARADAIAYKNGLTNGMLQDVHLRE
mmetsp:Transcript_59275/g.152591  ORF Transcript_59275/g.152591 Transcript_59275/m.152591 type:complete len:176 (+) Transcript_59275:107-634(+)